MRGRRLGGPGDENLRQVIDEMDTFAAAAAAAAAATTADAAADAAADENEPINITPI